MIGADRVDDRLLARQQLAAASAAHRGSRCRAAGSRRGRPGAGPRAAASDRRGARSASAGPTASATVTATSTATAMAAVRGRRTVWERNRRRWPRSAAARDPGSVQLSVEERTVGLAGERRRRPSRRRWSRRAARSPSCRPPARGRAGGWTSRMQAPRARASATTSRVASTPIGSTPSKGSSSSRTSGSCSAASTTLRRRLMPWLNPPTTRCATSPSSKRSSRSRPRASHSGIRRRRAVSWRCSHGVARGTSPPTSGQ